MKGPDEVGQVAEAGREGHVRDRLLIIRQQPRCAAQSGPDEVLIGSDAEYMREQPQEMKRAQTGGLRHVFEMQRLMGVAVYPDSGLDSAAAIARRAVDRL